MSDPITLPAPATAPITLPHGKWAREYQAFLRLLPQLLATHRGRYVAIHEGKVVAAGDDKLALALQVLSEIGNVAIHVGLVAEAAESVSRSGVRREIRTGGGVL